MTFLLAQEAVQKIVEIPDPTSFGWWLKNFGPTGVVLCAIGLCLWKICLFLKPYIVKIGEGHVQLIQKLGDTQDQQLKDLAEIRGTQSDHGLKLTAMHDYVTKRPRSPRSLHRDEGDEPK